MLLECTFRTWNASPAITVVYFAEAQLPQTVLAVLINPSASDNLIGGTLVAIVSLATKIIKFKSV